MLNKIYLYFFLVLVVIIVAVTVLVNKGYRTGDKGVSLSPNPSPTPTVILNENSFPSPTINLKPKPTPALIFKETKTYEQLAHDFDESGNRRLALAPDCSYIIPSQNTYKNNTELMLDNTNSLKRQILKIGDREYLLEAGEWFLFTISNPVLPVSLSIYCGSIELGAIELVK